MRGLDALQVVALEDRIIASEDEYPSGEAFWRAVEALRSRGAHVPEYDPPDDRATGEPVAVLPNSPRARAATNRWGDLAPDRSSDGADGLSMADARERTRDAIADAYRRGDRVLIEALPTLGKSYGAVAAAADTGEPITMLTGRGRKEQYEQIREWCRERGLTYKTLPSFLRECDTANGEHGADAAERVRAAYRRGATGQEIHRDGSPPCMADSTPRCPHPAKWSGFDADDYDVLIGHYTHGHVESATQGRTVVFDEFPGSAYHSTLGDLAGPVSAFLRSADADALPDDYADLMAAREDPQRRADALAWFDGREGRTDRDGRLAFDPDGHADAPTAAFVLLAAAENDLGNGWERASLPGEGGHVGLFDREKSEVHLLRPPDLRYSSGVVALDGTPTPRMWKLALGTRLNHRQVLTDAERAGYVRDTLGLNIVRTTEAVKPYSGSEENVAVEQDRALLDAIGDEHGQRPDLITTATAERAFDGADVLDAAASTRHYGNLKGSNALADSRLGAVVGSRNYGDGFVKMWGALDGYAVAEPDREDPENRGTGLSYGAVGDEILRHMREHETMQAAMRVGRDGGGATVYCHTNTLPEWVEREPADGSERVLAGEGRVLRARSDGERQVLDALASAGWDRWRTADLADHPEVEIGERQVRTHLNRFVREGYLAAEHEGRGLVWRDDGLHRVSDRGEVELPAVEPDTIEDGAVAEVPRCSTYTWDFRKTRAAGERSGGGTVEQAESASDTPDPPPEPGG
jgi:hypothetical protein